MLHRAMQAQVRQHELQQAFVNKVWLLVCLCSPLLYHCFMLLLLSICHVSTVHLPSQEDQQGRYESAGVSTHGAGAEPDGLPLPGFVSSKSCYSRTSHTQVNMTHIFC